MIKTFATLLLCILSFAGSAAVTFESTDETNHILSESHIKDLGITEWTLKNGMKVIVKPTEFESDEVFIRFSAPGGLASLSPEDFAAGDLAAQMAWESGLGHWSCDQVSVFLYEHSLEVQVKIQPFSRIIEGTADEDGMETYLELANLYFNSRKFTKEGFDTVIAQTRETLKKKRSDFDATFEEAVRAANTKDMLVPYHIHLEDLEKINFKKAKKLHEMAYSNPGDFICVMVGNLDPDELKPLVNRYLGTLPDKGKSAWPEYKHKLQFADGITQKVVPIHTRADSLTRITLPIQVKPTQENIRKVELMAQIIEGRLRNLFREKMNTSHGIDVGYEFPCYPLTQLPWLTLQYRSESNKVVMLNEIILNEIQVLLEKGPTESEIKDALSQQNRSDEFWLKDNYFWMATLSNYYMWGWDPKNISKPISESPELTSSAVKKWMQKFVSSKNYSVISTQPSK
jgi:predicted Zn-dependent peptidase